MFLLSELEGKCFVERHDAALFFPFGGARSGYAVGSAATFKKLRRQFQIFWWSILVAAICLPLVSYWQALLFELPFATLLYFLWVRRSVRHYKLVPVRTSPSGDIAESSSSFAARFEGVSLLGILGTVAMCAIVSLVCLIPIYRSPQPSIIYWFGFVFFSVLSAFSLYIFCRLIFERHLRTTGAARR